MGSWSVYCNFSNITITYGQKCVLVPLLEMGNHEIGIGYTNIRLFTLPIYGVYDDYGRIDDIEETENTKLIEATFDCKIKDFADALTDGRDGPEIPILKRFKNVTYCWVNREVWDFMASVKNEDGLFAHMGNHKLLLRLGFNYCGEDETIERYKHKYELNGAHVYSDGNFIKDHIFRPKQLKEHVPDVDLTFFDDTDEFDLWPFYKSMTIMQKFYSLMGIDNFINVFFKFKTMESADGNLKDLFSRQYNDQCDRFNPIQRTYYDQRKNPIIMNEFAKVARVIKHAYSFSNYLKPYVLFITPQCGEHEEHQLFLDKFAEINQNIINEYRTENYE